MKKGSIGSLRESVHPGLFVVREAGRGGRGLYYTSQEAVRGGGSRDGSAGFGRRGASGDLRVVELRREWG